MCNIGICFDLFDMKCSFVWLYSTKAWGRDDENSEQNFWVGIDQNDLSSEGNFTGEKKWLIFIFTGQEQSEFSQTDMCIVFRVSLGRLLEDGAKCIWTFLSDVMLVFQIK